MRISGVIVTLGLGVLGVLCHSTLKSPPHASAPRLAGVANAAVTRAEKAAPPAPPAVTKVEDLPPVELRKLTPQELTPTLISKSEALLWKYDDSPIGSEFLLEAEGRSIVARFEQHYHEWGGPVRPWGPHKGITLYAAE
jgi:hypothetical protein